MQVPIHKAQYRIRTHEIDVSKQITSPAIIQIMQEASMQQVIDIAASVWDLEKEKLTWVLMKKELSVFHRPLLNDEITVHTYPSGFNRFFATRDYKCFDKEGCLFASATSVWVLIHLESRKMVKMLDRFLNLELPETSILPQLDFKLKTPKNPKLIRSHKVGQFDLDWNKHLNNSILNNIMLTDLEDPHSIKKLQLAYKSEALYKDEIEIYCHYNSDNAEILAWNKTRTKELALVKAFF